MCKERTAMRRESQKLLGVLIAGILLSYPASSGAIDPLPLPDRTPVFEDVLVVICDFQGPPTADSTVQIEDYWSSGPAGGMPRSAARASARCAAQRARAR